MTVQMSLSTHHFLCQTTFRVSTIGHEPVPPAGGRSSGTMVRSPSGRQQGRPQQRNLHRFEVMKQSAAWYEIIRRIRDLSYRTRLCHTMASDNDALYIFMTARNDADKPRREFALCPWRASTSVPLELAGKEFGLSDASQAVLRHPKSQRAHIASYRVPTSAPAPQKRR